MNFYLIAKKKMTIKELRKINNEKRIRELLGEFNNEVYNSDELWQLERHNEGDWNHHYEFCCYKIYRDWNLSPIRYEFQDREYIYSDKDMIKRLQMPFNH